MMNVNELEFDGKMVFAPIIIIAVFIHAASRATAKFPRQSHGDSHMCIHWPSRKFSLYHKTSKQENEQFYHKMKVVLSKSLFSDTFFHLFPISLVDCSPSRDKVVGRRDTSFTPRAAVPRKQLSKKFN